MRDLAPALAQNKRVEGDLFAEGKFGEVALLARIALKFARGGEVLIVVRDLGGRLCLAARKYEHDERYDEDGDENE